MKFVLYDRKGRVCLVFKMDSIGLGFCLKNDRVVLFFCLFCKYLCGYFFVFDCGLILLMFVGFLLYIDNFWL